LQQLRSPRLAEIVAASLRDDILSGRLREGDSLPRQEQLLTKYRVSLPALREAMRILENEGLVTVRRGNVGGATVHLPTPERTAHMISMVLQSRATTADDVSAALLQMEPICAGLCAARADRLTTVVPQLWAIIAKQKAEFADAEAYTPNARLFHETLVANCGNQTMIVVIGALEAIWSANESATWDESRQPADPSGSSSSLAIKIRRAAIRDHERMVTAIENGNEQRASSLATTHLTATRASTLESGGNPPIMANLLDGTSVSGVFDLH
jgi:GntR family transcriptional repressor for pyruvate dehydrogenase complex